MVIDKNKQYRTRDGREVRIYATDGFDGDAVHGAVKFDGRWHSENWDKDGAYYIREDALDLIEIRPRIEREYWVNVFSDAARSRWNMTKSDADTDRYATDRIACVKVVIDCEEGEGL